MYPKYFFNIDNFVSSSLNVLSANLSARTASAIARGDSLLRLCLIGEIAAEWARIQVMETPGYSITFDSTPPRKGQEANGEGEGSGGEMGKNDGSNLC